MNSFSRSKGKEQRIIKSTVWYLGCWKTELCHRSEKVWSVCPTLDAQACFLTCFFVVGGGLVSKPSLHGACCSSGIGWPTEMLQAKASSHDTGICKSPGFFQEARLLVSLDGSRWLEWNLWQSRESIVRNSKGELRGVREGSENEPIREGRLIKRP